MLRANPCNPCLVAVRHWSGGGPMWIAQSIDTERLTRLVIWLWVRPSAPCMDGAAPAHARRVPDVDCFGASRLSATAFRQVSCSAVRACQCRQDFGGVAGQERCDGQVEAGEDAAVQHALRVRQLRTVVVVFQAEPFQARFGHQPDQVFAHAVAAVGPCKLMRLAYIFDTWGEATLMSAHG